MSLEAFYTPNYNLLVPYYLMMAYRYYVKDDPMVSDSLFDMTAKKLLKEWENIKHFHKYLLNTDMLVAGTYIGDYPTIVEDASYAVSNKEFEKKLRGLLA